MSRAHLDAHLTSAHLLEFRDEMVDLSTGPGDRPARLAPTVNQPRARSKPLQTALNLPKPGQSSGRSPAWAIA